MGFTARLETNPRRDSRLGGNPGGGGDKVYPRAKYGYLAGLELMGDRQISREEWMQRFGSSKHSQNQSQPKESVCPRCNGWKGFTDCQHINQSKCFLCQGTGLVLVKVAKSYTGQRLGADRLPENIQSRVDAGEIINLAGKRDKRLI